MNFEFIANEAYGLRKTFFETFASHRPYMMRCRARCYCVENAFGQLAARFRIFHTSNLTPFKS
ncbi:hypothetical protein PR048_029870 [Dryococelus australis]|uniref:DDE Tnp4 domain-containing protein n=1 Tax=Dryococelus australis TaxID=614101 RepID=A0ABQ9G7C3_9NEOP|nr:hypothetical protein PR048_029870 [Dryococelus australis]